MYLCRIENANYDTSHCRLAISFRLNPVYDDDTKSTFLLEWAAYSLYNVGGLKLQVKDWDRGLGGNNPLGEARVAPEDLYCISNGEPREYKIVPPTGRENEDAGYLTIRSRPATEEDLASRRVTFDIGAKNALKSDDVTFNGIKSIDDDRSATSKQEVRSCFECAKVSSSFKRTYTPPLL